MAFGISTGLLARLRNAPATASPTALDARLGLEGLSIRSETFQATPSGASFLGTLKLGQRDLPISAKWVETPLPGLPTKPLLFVHTGREPFPADLRSIAEHLDRQGVLLAGSLRSSGTVLKGFDRRLMTLRPAVEDDAAVYLRPKGWGAAATPTLPLDVLLAMASDAVRDVVIHLGEGRHTRLVRREVVEAAGFLPPAFRKFLLDRFPPGVDVIRSQDAVMMPTGWATQSLRTLGGGTPEMSIGQLRHRLSTAPAIDATTRAHAEAVLALLEGTRPAAMLEARAHAASHVDLAKL